MLDGNPATLWHTEYTKRQPAPPHELTLTFPAPQSITAVLLTQRQDHNANGQVAEVEIVADGKVLMTAKVPKNATNRRVTLPAGTRAKELTIRALKSHAGPYACLAEIEIEAQSEGGGGQVMSGPIDRLGAGG